MNVDLTTPVSEQQFFPIFLESLRVDDVLDFDLYIARGQQYVLYRSAAEPFTEKTRAGLIENNITRLFVAKNDRRHYQKYLETNLPQLTADTSIAESVRAEIVYECALSLVEDLFAKPTLPENVKRSQDLVKTTVEFILISPTACSALLDILAYDYTTYTHSINACTLALALAIQVGVTNPRDLQALGTGALLHDIGKTKIPELIFNKIEPLTPDELFVIKRHPKWGCDLARQSALLDERSYYAILQHHERENGSGYPLAIGGANIHLFGKITAIVDAFDAMTTRKTYRPAIDAFHALQQMFADRGAFDSELLSEFTRMLGPSATGEAAPEAT
jgi:putative nucleotidyltransferase with HDIG domain